MPISVAGSGRMGAAVPRSSRHQDADPYRDYLDGSGTLVESAAINLNGTTPVAAGFTATGIEWMEATDGGSSEISAGNIVLRVVSGAVEIEQITAGGNKSLSGRAYVPTGFSGYIPFWSASAINNDQDVRLRAKVHTLDRTANTRYLFLDVMYVPNNTSNNANLPWIKFPAGANIKVSTISAGTGATIRCDVSFVLVLVAD